VREIRQIEARIKQVERQLEATAAQLLAVEHLRTIPGIGLLIATALVAFLGDIRRFPSGRHLASYLGLTPREYSSGLERHLARISKRGEGHGRVRGTELEARQLECPAGAATYNRRCRQYRECRNEQRGHRVVCRGPENTQLSCEGRAPSRSRTSSAPIGGYPALPFG
jgi:hypothetical protein